MVQYYIDLLQKGLLMNFFKFFKKWLADACVYFTAIALIMILGNLILNGFKDADNIHAGSFLLFFPFGLCLSAAGLLFSSKSLPSWAKYLLHFAITDLSLFLFLWLPSNSGAQASTGIIMLTLFSILYWIFLGLVVWIRSRVRKLMEED